MQKMHHTMQDNTGYHWGNKRVVIAGLARSGVAAAHLLLLAGAQPILWDTKTKEELRSQEIDQLIEKGCELIAGHTPESALMHADVLIVSPGIPLDAAIIVQAIAQDVPVLGELELGARFVRGPLYAVTGTNGKTTTVTLLGEILRQAGRVVHVCGNIGHPLSAAVAQGKEDDVYVVEVSSFQLETVQHFHPTIAAVLNITPDHLNRHGSLARYAALKGSIFSRQTTGDIAVLNAEDPLVFAMRDGLQGRVAMFSKTDWGYEGAFVRDGMLMLRWDDVEQQVCAVEEIRIPGAHNLENALAATTIAGIAGVPPAVIRYALRSFAGVEHRIEFVREVAGVWYINDSKGTNPDATIKAVEAMRVPTILLAGGVDKQIPFDRLAEVIQNSGMVRHVIVYGQTAHAIERALRLAGYGDVEHRTNMQAAFDRAHELATHGFNVLLSPACASFDQFSDYEERGRRFKELVNQLHEPPTGGTNG